MTKRLNDVTPEEWTHSSYKNWVKPDLKSNTDATEYYKKLDEKLPDDYWDDEDRINVIGQNGNDGLHYKEDAVTKPKHYVMMDFEVIDIIFNALNPDEFRGYCLGNIIKYRMRAGKKNDAAEDLAKADEYEKIWSKYYATK